MAKRHELLEQLAQETLKEIENKNNLALDCIRIALLKAFNLCRDNPEVQDN